jgi:hypothetical protein
MQLTFIQLSPFKARWNELRLSDEDLQALESMILGRPEIGAVVSQTGGIRKVRSAPPSRHMGKSGALRIGYAYYRLAGTVYLVAIVVKSNQANFSAAQKKELRGITAELNKLHRQQQ